MNYSIALVQLPLVSEAGEEQITTPTEAHRACSDMAVLAQECFHVLCLDTRNRLINRHMVSLGAADSCPASPRDVFRPTISDGATAIVIVHNYTADH
jgi:DNA repair protein RadC